MPSFLFFVLSFVIMMASTYNMSSKIITESAKRTLVKETDSYANTVTIRNEGVNYFTVDIHNISDQLNISSKTTSQVVDTLNSASESLVGSMEDMKLTLDRVADDIRELSRRHYLPWYPPPMKEASRPA